MEEYSARDHFFPPASEHCLICVLLSITPVFDRMLREPELEDGPESIDTRGNSAVRGNLAQTFGETVAEGGLRLTLRHERHGEVAIPAPPATLRATPASVRALPQPIKEPPIWAARAALQGTSGAESVGAPLAGIKVLNLGTVIAGAFAGTLLANLGADVIKIEPPEADPFRSDGPGFLSYNRGVRGLGLNFRKPGARELFLEMVRDADVVIDNYRLGVRTRLGIDYETLRKINPRIITCSVNAYGDKGARAALPGFDPLMQAEGGMMAAQGGEGDPILYTIAVNDVATASVVTMSVVAALNARERTGEGQEIVTSLMAQSLLFQLGEMVTYEGRPPNDVGGVDCLGPRALHRYYACADGWIGLVCETDVEAQALARALRVDLGPAPLLATRDGEVAERLASVLAAQPRDAVLDLLLAAGVAAAPVVRSAETLTSDYLWGNGFLDAWEHGRLGPMITVGDYAKFSRSRGGPTRPTPDLGENTVELLIERGLSSDQIAALLAEGAVFASDGMGGVATTR